MPGSGFRLTNGSPESRAGYMKCPCGDIFNSHCLEENLVHVLHISAAAPERIQGTTTGAESTRAIGLKRAHTLPPRAAPDRRGFWVIDALEQYFFVARRLVAAALPTRDPATVVPLNRGSLHAAALSWADGDPTWTEANRGVGVVPATVRLGKTVAPSVGTAYERGWGSEARNLKYVAPA